MKFVVSVQQYIKKKYIRNTKKNATNVATVPLAAWHCSYRAKLKQKG